MVWTSHILGARVVGWLLIISTAFPIVVPDSSCGCVLKSNCCGRRTDEVTACDCCAKARSASEITKTCCQRQCTDSRFCGRNVRTCWFTIADHRCTGSANATCGKSGCTCGVSCPCQSSKMPPAAPLAEGENHGQKLVVNQGPSLVASLIGGMLRKPHRAEPLAMAFVAALQRCISLCRFTI